MEDDDSIETRRLVARLRFRHLHLLVTLREGGSLRAAAGVLNLTQPAAVSKAAYPVGSSTGASRIRCPTAPAKLGSGLRRHAVPGATARRNCRAPGRPATLRPATLAPSR